MAKGVQPGTGSGLPERLRSLFWDHDFQSLSWREHREFIIGRVLASGDWDSVQWLRCRIGDRGVREWIERHAGRGLSRRQLRFWELILGLPAAEVDGWLSREGRRIWDERTRA